MLSSLCSYLRHCTLNGHQILQNVNRSALVTVQQKKTFTLRRKWPPPPGHLKTSGKIKWVKPKHTVYIVDATIRSRKLLKLILTEDVEDIGVAGDVVLVPKRVGRRDLLRCNKAVYASPENIEEFARQDDGRDLPLTVSATLKHLINKILQLDVKCLESDPKWDELPYAKERIIHAFKKNLGVIVADDAVTLPEEPIKDYGRYSLKLTINGTETIPIEMDVVRKVMTA